MKGCVSENEMFPRDGENCVTGSVPLEQYSNDPSIQMLGIQIPTVLVNLCDRRATGEGEKIGMFV